MAAVEVRELSTVYPNGVRAVDGLSLRIADGEFFALLGPSGCGKTTLLRTIAGLEPAASGRVLIGDVDVTRTEPGKRRVAMVFQDYALFPHMTVTDNVAYPLRVRGVSRAERVRTAERTTASLSLAGLSDRRPAQLSGGQQQRVALARAVASGGELLLLDEPLSNLDARLRLEARTFLKRLQRELGVTTIFVTHDQAEALALADRIAVMDAGRIRQLGTPSEVFRRPASTFVANFIGSTPMNLVDGSLSNGTVLVAGAQLPALVDGAPSPEVVVGVRPEYLTLHATRPAAAAFEGTVAVVETLGVSSLVTIECADGVTIGATVPEGSEPAVTTKVYATPQPGRLLLYSRETGELLGAAGS
ncbi:MAG TPA: ABC transporter ATP-binding protein [Pseudonocardiaceae bacterium]|nr:ABC transporter ATP-binding protein [Pseudonocardiaceae bacterium]